MQPACGLLIYKWMLEYQVFACCPSGYSAFLYLQNVPPTV